MNDKNTPQGGSQVPFLRPNSPMSSLMPGMSFMNTNQFNPPQQPSLGSQLWKGFQNSMPAKVLGIASMATDNVQEAVKAPIAAGFSKVASPQAANIAASNIVSFFTPPGLSMVQGMNKIMQSGGQDGKGETTLTATKAAVSKMGHIPALLVTQLDIMQGVGESFYQAGQAQKQSKGPRL